MGISPNTQKSFLERLLWSCLKFLKWTILRKNYFTTCFPFKQVGELSKILWKSKSVFIKNKMVSKHKNTSYDKTFHVNISLSSLTPTSGSLLMHEHVHTLCFLEETRFLKNHKSIRAWQPKEKLKWPVKRYLDLSSLQFRQKTHQLSPFVLVHSFDRCWPSQGWSEEPDQLLSPGTLFSELGPETVVINI